MVQIIDREALRGTPRHVRRPEYETFRFLLAGDGTGATVTDIVLAPGIEATYGSDPHTEMAYCIEGHATLTDLRTSSVHEIRPGILWVARPGEYFRFVASEPTRLICVFTPPFSGGETGMAEGSPE